MQLENFEVLVNSQGLVPMKIVQSFAPYDENAIAGFPPAEAFRLFKREAAVPVGADGQPISIEISTPEVQQPSAPSSIAEIPADWESQHHLQRLRIAKEIKPDAGQLSVVDADKIIRAEIDRRSQSA